MSTPVPTPNTNYQPKALLTEEDGAAFLSLLQNLNVRIESLEIQVASLTKNQSK